MADTDATAAAEARKNLPADARNLIATVRNDITIPHFTTVMQPIDDTLIQRGGGKGLKIYDDVERDTHAYAVLQKRKFALIARDWEIEPASETPLDRKAAAFVESVLTRLNFDQLCLDLLDATLKGYSVAEIVWMRDGNQILPERIVAHDPRRFTFDENWRPRLLTMAAPSDGEELPDRKFIVHRFGVKGNNPFGLGLGSRLFWPVLFKREGIAFWLTFLEKFASPTPIGEYPLGTLPEDQNRLLSNLADMVQAGAIVVPAGTSVKFLEAARAGQAGYAEWCKYWDTQMSLCVFGSTLATYVEGQGSRAASETHKEGEEQIIDSDADLLTDTFHGGFFRWLVEYNVPGAGVPTLRRIRPKNAMQHEELRKKQAENMKAELDLLFNFAAKVPPERFAELAASLAGVDLMPQIPIEILRKLAPDLARARVNLTEAARSGELPMPGTEADPEGDRFRQIAFATGNASDAHDHGMTDIAAQLQGLAQPSLDAWLGHIRGELDGAVAAGEDLAQFGERLLKLEPSLTIDPLGNIIADAFTVGELTGRADVQDTIAARHRRRRK